MDELHKKKTTTVTKSLEKIAVMLGLPTILKSNGGPGFKSKPFTDFTDKYGIYHILTSAYHPASNGQAKRAIQEAEKMMEKCQSFNQYHKAFMFNNT